MLIITQWLADHSSQSYNREGTSGSRSSLLLACPIKFDSSTPYFKILQKEFFKKAERKYSFVIF